MSNFDTLCLSDISDDNDGILDGGGAETVNPFNDNDNLNLDTNPSLIDPNAGSIVSAPRSWVELDSPDWANIRGAIQMGGALTDVNGNSAPPPTGQAHRNSAAGLGQQLD